MTETTKVPEKIWVIDHTGAHWQEIAPAHRDEEIARWKAVSEATLQQMKDARKPIRVEPTVQQKAYLEAREKVEHALGDLETHMLPVPYQHYAEFADALHELLAAADAMGRSISETRREGMKKTAYLDGIYVAAHAEMEAGLSAKEQK